MTFFVWLLTVRNCLIYFDKVIFGDFKSPENYLSLNVTSRYHLMVLFDDKD